MELNIEKIKQLIYKQGIDIPTFYKKQGWSRFKWHYMIKRDASGKTIDKLADALGVNPKSLIK